MKTTDRMTESRPQAYERMAKAIRYIETHFQNQPDLEEVASAVNLSAFHFQRLFTEWTGVSPKKFLQHLSVAHAKNQLRQSNASVLDAAFEVGLSGPGRLHDLFVTIEAMTPGEYKNEGASLSFDYEFADTPMGRVLLASTSKGLSHLAFIESEAEALDAFSLEFPQAKLREASNPHHDNALKFFRADWSTLKRSRLHLKASPFQLKIWQCLLRVPADRFETYGSLAKAIDRPKAARAVGSAVGANPVAYLIPCHRVIRANGEIGGYRWGLNRKKMLISWDASVSI